MRENQEKPLKNKLFIKIYKLLNGTVSISLERSPINSLINLYCPHRPHWKMDSNLIVDIKEEDLSAAEAFDNLLGEVCENAFEVNHGSPLMLVEAKLEEEEIIPEIEEPPEPEIISDLRNWAHQTNITHKQLSVLLEILNKHYGDTFPKDATTLMKETTEEPRSYPIETESYVYFGLEMENLL